MHRRFTKSLATVMGAAALMVAPIALIAPAAQAEHVLTPDYTLENDDFYNNEDNWAEELAKDEELVDVMCEKIEGAALTDPFLLPELAPDRFYVLAVVKGGSGDDANEVYEEPEAGHYLSHATAGNSHIILCTADTIVVTTPPVTTPPTTKPPVTGPVVETDRVADTGSSANLGLAAAAIALIAGLGGIVVSRRRQGAHR